MWYFWEKKSQAVLEHIDSLDSTRKTNSHVSELVRKRNDLDGVRAEHCGARVYLGNYCFGAEPAAAHSTP